MRNSENTVIKSPRV